MKKMKMGFCNEAKNVTNNSIQIKICAFLPYTVTQKSFF